jgi:uncharacterized protein (TIGR03067 family)
MGVRALMVVAVLSLAAAGGGEEQAAKELKKFEGTWVLDAGEKDGTRVADEHIRKSRITWKGKEIVAVTPHQSAEPIKGTITVDPTKVPREMDWVRSAGPGAGRRMKAIYEFIGEDRYRVCFAPAGKDRPKEFATKQGSGHTLHVWKRAKE